MAANPLLSGHIASRSRSIDFAISGMLLPNPDPILKAQGRDVRVYRDMQSDAHIGGCIRRRKSAVKALEWGLDRDRAASRVTKAVKEMLDGIDIERFIGQSLEASLYGYQPIEVMWENRNGLFVPAELEAKPPEWFAFDEQNQLRFKSREAMLHGEELPPRKFLLPRQDPTYANPYGFADMSLCFWPLVFKKGGMKFWLAFTEKFGSAFSVGKLPRGAQQKERDDMLDSLEKLIQDGVATIPDDGSVELIEMAGKSASADLYERLVMHCRSEIAIALLGQNQTTEANSNRASATAGLEVTAELRDADAGMVAASVNQLIQWICELNFAGAQAPVFSLWDQEAQDKLQAERDQSNHTAGARFTNAYWMRAYGYQEGDLAGPETAPQASPRVLPPAAFAEGAAADPVASQVAALDEATRPDIDGLVGQLQAMVERADSMATLQQELADAYGGLDSGRLVQIMAAAFALAELKGMDAVRGGE